MINCAPRLGGKWLKTGKLEEKKQKQKHSNTVEKMFPYDANMSTIVQEPRRVWKRFVQKWGWAAGAMMANLPFSMSAVFNKGFFPLFSLPLSLHLPPPPPPGLRGCSRPPRRLQTDVLGGAEHALLDVTSSYRAVKEAKGCLPCKKQSIKTRAVLLSAWFPPLRKPFVQQDAVRNLWFYGNNKHHFSRNAFLCDSK